MRPFSHAETTSVSDPDAQSSVRLIANRLANVGKDLPFFPVRPYENRRLQLAWRALLLVTIVIAVFYGSLGPELLWRDERIVHDLALQSWAGFGTIWSDPFDQSSPLGVRMMNWLVGRVFGGGVLPIRLLLLFLHAITVVMLWFALRRLNVKAAWLAVAVLGVHPAVVPTVAWISRQADVLGTACAAIAIWSYLRAREVRPHLDETIWTDPVYHVDADARARWPWIMFGFAMFVGLWSGSLGAVVAPASLLIVEQRIVDNRPPRRLLILLVALGIAAVLSAWWYSQSPVPRQVELTVAAGGTLSQLLVPLRLPFAFDRINFPNAWTMVALGLCAAWAGLGVARIRHASGCFALMGLMLAFCHGLFIRSPDNAAVSLADVVAYPALVVMVPLVVAAIMVRFAHKLSADAVLTMRWFVAACLIVGLGAITAMRAPAYAGGDAIWQYALSVDPNGVFAREQLATRFLAQGYLEEAANQLDRVPTARRDVSWQVARARAFEAQKNYTEAAACYETAHQLDPSSTAVLLSLAESRSNAGQPEQAAQLYRKALEHAPHDAGLYTNAGLTQMRLGRLQEAADFYEKALRIDARFLPAHINLANVLFNLGQYEKSAKHLQEAVRIDPRNFAAFMNAGILLCRLHDAVKAERMFRAAVNLDPTSPDAFDNLGIVLAAQGKVADAVWSFTQATRLNPDHGAAGHLADVRRQLRSQNATQPVGLGKR